MKHRPRTKYPDAGTSRARGILVACGLLLSLVAAPAQAQEVAMHGFLSQGYLKSTGNNYLGSTKPGSWEYSEAAINFSTTVTDDLTMGLQFFTRELGNLGNFQMEIDWAFGDYAYEDWLGFRVGRIKMPYGLYGEIQDFDIVRATVLLPQSVYYLALRDLLVSFNGTAIYGTFDLPNLGNFDYQLFGGAATVPNAAESSVAYYFNNEAYDPESGLQSFKITDIKNKYLFGGSLKWDTLLDGLVLNGTFTRYQAKATATLSPTLTRTLDALGQRPEGWSDHLKITMHDITFWVASAQYTSDNLTLTAEYAQYYGLFEMSAAPVIPHTTLDQERWYTQVEYRFSDLVQVAAYYSYLYDANDAQKAAAGLIPDHGSYMKDKAIALRFDITDSWLFKLEAHHFDGTAQVYALENKKHPQLKRFWTLLAAKTTVTF